VRSAARILKPYSLLRRRQGDGYSFDCDRAKQREYGLMMRQILFVAAFLILVCGMTNAQICRVAQMNTEQIRALDKQKTVVILTGGIIEEHGPHLSSFTDGYSNEWLAQKLAEEIVCSSRPFRSGTEARTRLAQSMSSPALIQSAAQRCERSLWT
jgi:Na+-transporting NADH:ubiquinone oxidoreductase subunit NqrC